MDCTAEQKIGTARRPATADIELTSIDHDKGKLVVWCKGEGMLWPLICQGSDLQTFAKFQAKFANEHGTWISHWSQHSTRAATRKREWEDAVRDAFQQRDRLLAEFDRRAAQ